MFGSRRGSAIQILLKNRFRKVDKGLPYHSCVPEGWWRELKEQCKINDEDELSMVGVEDGKHFVDFVDDDEIILWISLMMKI